METIFRKTEGLTDALFHYCPGCTHGIIHRIVAETLEELDVLGKHRCCAGRLRCIGIRIF